MSKKNESEKYEQELRDMNLLNEKLNLYNNIKSTFTTYDAENKSTLHINNNWLIEKTLGQEFLDNFLDKNEK